MPHRNRALTEAESRLVRWMLEHGTPDAAEFVPQLGRLEVTAWRCPCGCASIDFQVDGQPKEPASMQILGDFVFDNGGETSGAFVYASDGVLSGLEVYAVSGDAPRALPAVEDLRPA